tara:strand:+ start:123 stop:3344 length:3222 start_codon:yes stop_codon:yes gene_type:complete
MSSYLLAKGVGESLNEDSYEVRIIRTAAGSDQTTEFTLAANGFALKYESVDDSALVPGIMHSRCEVTTLWPAAIHAKLNLLLTALATSTDGDYLLEVLRYSTRIWVGSILVEEFEVNEDSTNKEVTIVATDGLSLLRHVDYNNSGTAYTGYQTVYDIVKNIQEKWSLYTYLNAQNSGTEYRLAWAEDVYSEDDYIMAAETHPAGTDLKSIKRSRIHTNPWSSVNSSGATEYISCYDLLQSLCITYQWRLYSYGDAWHMLPVALAGERTPGTVLQWNGTEVDRDVISEYQFQKDAANDVRQKDGAWRLSYTAPHNEVRVTRDTLDGATLVGGYNETVPETFTDTEVTYEGADTAPDSDLYWLQASFVLDNTALSLDDYSYGQVVLKYTIKFATSSAAQYYKNTIQENSGLLQSVGTTLGLVDYTPAVTIDPQYSSSVSVFYYVPVDTTGKYLVNYAGSRVFVSEIIIPPPPTEKVGLSVTVDYDVFNENLALSSTYKAATTLTLEAFQVRKFTGDQLELVPNYDIVANTVNGRGSLDLGTTVIGDRGFFGSVEVQTSSGVYGSTIKWVCQANNTQRQINTLAVQETLARHNKPKGLERGSIVLRGTSAAVPSPFNFYKDLDTATSYAPVNWQLNATACEVDLTLRKTGRDAISVTTEVQDAVRVPVPTSGSTGQPVAPNLPVTRGFNVQAASKFAENWAGVIGSETLESYYTVLPDGTGKKVSAQGDTPASGFAIRRKIYFRLLGLHGAADGGWLALPVNQPALNDTLATAFDKIDLYMAALATSTAGSYSFIVTHQEVGDDLLDNYSGATAAYGLRRLRAAYTGNAIEVTNGSTTQDIGFDSNGDLNQSALETYASGAEVKVSKWYDQANSNNLSQTSDAARPTITDSSGNMLTLNGKPAMKLAGAQSLPAASNFNANANINELVAAWVGSVNQLTSGNNMVSHWASSTGSQVFQVQMTASNDNLRWAVRYSNATGIFTDNGSAITSGAQYIVVAKAQNGVQAADFDGTNVASSPPSVAVNDASTSFRVGARSDNSAGAHTGFTQEVVVWSRGTAQNDHEAISDTMNTYYSSY